MKLLGKSEDQATGNLLRARFSRPSGPVPPCANFDPDLANAYVERALSGPPLARFETHLSECATCRAGVRALSRLAAAERESLSQPAISTRTDRINLERFWRAPKGPQWAMAAAAVVVLAISLPLLLSSNQTADLAVPQSEVETRAPQPPASGPTEAPSSDRPAPARSDDSIHQKKEAGAASGGYLGNAQSEDRRTLEKKAEPENVPHSMEETKPKTEGQIVAAQAPDGAPQSKGDSDRAREQQEKEAAVVAQPKPPSADQQGVAQQKSQRAELAAAPPPPAPSGSGRGLRQPGAKLALRDSSVSESVRPRADYRELRGKKFFLRDGTWTDKDYDPDRDLPIINVVRDSNVYNELLTKRASLKPYLALFSETERAIIVYKGTVYKLIPQHDDK
jgi:hypothetical protein